MRTNFDFTPYRRSTVGFDRLFNLLEAGAREDDGYPLFDIVKLGDDSFRITLAIAGFRPDDIEIVAQQNQLTVHSLLVLQAWHRGFVKPAAGTPAAPRPEAARP